MAKKTDIIKLAYDATEFNKQRHFGSVQFEGMIGTLSERIDNAHDEGLKGGCLLARVVELHAS